MANSIRPDLFKNPKKSLDNMARAITRDILEETSSKAQSEGYKVSMMPRYLEITEKRLEKQGVIDLKPYFAKSDKKRYNKQGNWYMYIPIRVKTRDMSSRLYRELRAVPTGSYGSSKNTVSDYLYDRRKQSASVQSINYDPKSKTITKQNQGTRNIYTAYRTVNAQSPSSSWIINRSKVDENNMSKTMLRNIDNLMKWKLNNL